MTNLIKKILKETRTESIASYIPDLGKKIGEGVNGVAFDYMGKVIKITANYDEARLCNLFVNRPVKFFTKIYSVQEIYLNDKSTDTYAIIREKLSPLTKDEHIIITVIAMAVEYGEEANLNATPLQRYDKKYVRSIFDEFMELKKGLNNFKMYDLAPDNLGRKKTGTLAAFDAETEISFGDIKFPVLYLNSFEDEEIDESIILKEWNDEFPNTKNDPGYGLEFSEYISEDRHSVSKATERKYDQYLQKVEKYKQSGLEKKDALNKFVGQGWFVNFAETNKFKKEIPSGDHLVSWVPNGIYAFPLTELFLNKLLKEPDYSEFIYERPFIHLFKFSDENILSDKNYSKNQFVSDLKKILSPKKIQNILKNYNSKYDNAFQKLVNIVGNITSDSNKRKDIFLSLGYKGIISTNYSLTYDIKEQVVIFDPAIIKTSKTIKNPFLESNDDINEATDESLTMETGAIPNSLDETVKIMEVLKKLEEVVDIDLKPLSKEFLEALSEYVENGNRKKWNYYKKIIAKEALALPNNFRKAPPYLYRTVKIKDSFESFKSGIYGYTVSVESAMNFVSENYFMNGDNGKGLVIVKIKTDTNKVVLNLRLLIVSDLYKKSLKYHKLERLNIGTDEDEVLYNQSEITKNDFYLIYSVRKHKWIKADQSNQEKAESTKQDKIEKKAAIDDIIILRKRIDANRESYLKAKKKYGDGAQLKKLSNQSGWRDQMQKDLKFVKKLKDEFNITNKELPNWRWKFL